MDLMSLEITVVSAELGLDSEMKLYVVVTVTGGALSEQKAQTNVDTKGGGNPRWNFPMKFVVDRSAASHHHLTFTLKSEYSKDKYIGQLKLPIGELILQSTGDGNENSMQYVSYSLNETSGQLNFVFKFGALQAPRATHVPPPEPAGAANKYKKLGEGAEKLATGVATGLVIRALVPDNKADATPTAGINDVTALDSETAVPLLDTSAAVESVASESSTSFLESLFDTLLSFMSIFLFLFLSLTIF